MHNPQARLGRLFMPPGSSRERLFLLSIKAAKTARSQGVATMVRKVGGKVARKLGLRPPLPPVQPAPLQPQTPVVNNAELVREVLTEAVFALPAAQQYHLSLLSGMSSATNKGPSFVDDTPAEPWQAADPLVKLIAFYLPQYHPIPENDTQWGRGFTEWANVTRGMPQYLGHYQPHLPIDLGFYDLRVRENQVRQVELAKQYGIHGFAFYYYWFGGKRLLDKPLDSFVESPDIDFPFCLIWANENWTRRWDGHEDDVFMEQVHTPETDAQFIRDVERYLRHRNYIRVDGKPLLVVYKAQLIPNASETVGIWREYARKAGLGELYLVAAQTMGFEDPRPVGFDAAMQFPPHNEHMRPPFRIDWWNAEGSPLLNRDFNGGMYSYPSVVEYKLKDLPEPGYTLYETAFPMWDNTARRPSNGWIYAYSSPELYRVWLTRLCNKALARPNAQERMVFLNAWNEWAEGAHLEPDRKYGYAYLKATRDARRIAEHGGQENIEVPVDQGLVESLACPPRGAVFVYQMGKVGSMSVVTELERRNLGKPVIHSHMLNDLDRIAQVSCKIYPNPVGVLYEVNRGKTIRKWMAEAPPDVRWQVITMAREPVGRNVSAFFQTIEQLIPNIEARLAAGELFADELHDVFVHMFNSDAPEHWFTGQLEPVFGVDVLESPYDFEKGYQICQGERADVLAIRMEDLQRSIGPAMKQFMGLEDFPARRENTAEQKYYADIVRMFKRLPLPESYVDRMYCTPYARHFYTEQEIEILRSKWLSSAD